MALQGVRLMAYGVRISIRYMCYGIMGVGCGLWGVGLRIIPLVFSISWIEMHLY